MFYRSMPLVQEMTVDHPFIYALTSITDEQSHSVCINHFIGHMIGFQLNGGRQCACHPSPAICCEEAIKRLEQSKFVFEDCNIK